MHPFERLTLNHIYREKLLDSFARKVVVGVSGGPDSMALLHVLAALRMSLGITMTAVYVDHGLRPGESEAEKEYIRLHAEKLQTGFEAVQVEVKKYARNKKLSLEHAARDLRYGALRKVAAEDGADCIAVAHTADDQAEEILIRLIRGAGRKGLSGMRSRHRDIIRPFLRIEKEQILNYLTEKQIHFFDDSTNTDMRYLRNRVRLQLLPYLEQQFDRGIRRALCKTADSLAEDEDLLEEWTDQVMEQAVAEVSWNRKTTTNRIVIDRNVLIAQPIALQRRVVEKLLWQVGGRAAYTHIMKIIEAAGSARAGTELHLRRGLRVGVRKEYLELLYPQGKSSWRGRLYARK